MTATQTAVTADQIIAEVRRLAAERPDYVYEKPPGSTFCLYRHEDGSPGCIFGQALDNLGVGLDEHTYGTIGIVLFDLGVAKTDQQANWMTSVQHYQDNGRPWAEAVAKADEENGVV